MKASELVSVWVIMVWLDPNPHPNPNPNPTANPNPNPNLLRLSWPGKSLGYILSSVSKSVEAAHVAQSAWFEERVASSTKRKVWRLFQRLFQWLFQRLFQRLFDVFFNVFLSRFERIFDNYLKCD